MSRTYDIFVIGGGINGCGIARDAAGRGLSVCLAEMNDLASATSSASTKLFHGGLRYLEFFEFRLVREALIERETLLRAMPHISWPMRFVLPLSPEMRFDGDTPTSKLLSWILPWAKGKRPNWLIRLGLFLYDSLGGRQILPGTAHLDLTQGPEGAPLQDRFVEAYEYSDCWVEDARLVVLNARDAAARGARILTRTKVLSAERVDGKWALTLSSGEVVTAKALVNAAGPFVQEVIQGVTRQSTTEGVRLVRGSHIVTKRLFEHDKSYFFQGEDGRIIFAIPYETDFTLIGTTDADHSGAPGSAICTPQEADYLRAFASKYFRKPIAQDEIVWTYSGVRPLYDDGASSATAATRDYTLSLEANGAPVLNIFGGKITTYRRLAESAMEKLSPFFPGLTGSWTAGVALPGGNFPQDGVAALIAKAQKDYPFLTPFWAKRLVRAYGTEIAQVLGAATLAEHTGTCFGATLSEAELIWLRDKEWARSAEDVVWRRSKLGLRLTPEEIARIEAWFQDLANAVKPVSLGQTAQQEEA